MNYTNITNTNIDINKINIYNEHYNTLFCNNLNSSLKKELGLENMNDYKSPFISDLQPPTSYGLDNSQRIIPEHYFGSNQKSFKEIDMFYELTKDIRNLKPLNDIQLTYVKNLPKEKIIELLKIYNSCLESINQLFEN